MKLMGLVSFIHWYVQHLCKRNSKFNYFQKGEILKMSKFQLIKNIPYFTKCVICFNSCRETVDYRLITYWFCGRDICDPLSQNEHKVATAAIQNYYRFKVFKMQALKWYMICGYGSLFCQGKIYILCWFSFVFYCSVTCLTGSVCKLATLCSFCDSRSHI